LWNIIVPAVKQRACTILGEFTRAQTELVGKAVILTDGKAGTVGAFDSTKCMACASLSEATKATGPSQPSNSLRRPETLAEMRWASAPVIVIRVHSPVRRQLARLDQLDHIHRRKLA
jgi:hypothetical protein